MIQRLTYSLPHRKIGPNVCRYCRSGGGTEKTPGKGDTPGFNIREEDTIEQDKFKGLRVLKLKRNEKKMKQTSMSQLQSWRANCDVQILLYGHDPAKISSNDIANVSGYVVSYCTKGNISYESEREVIKTVVMAAEDEFAENSSMSTITLARKILNVFNSKRIISKAEVSCELLNLDLYKCTESFTKVSLSTYTRIRKNTAQNVTNQLTKYASRNCIFANLSFEQYFDKILTNNHNSNTDGRSSILYCYGLNGTPCYPISFGYAKATLIRHKPWSKKQRLNFEQKGVIQKDVKEEFEEFLASKDCPAHVKVRYEIAKENYRRLSRKRNCHGENDPESSGDGIDKSTADLIQACQIYSDDTIMSFMDKGMNYDWNKTHYPEIDKDFTKGVDWLMKTRDAYREEHGTKKYIPLRKNGTPYKIEDVEGDKDQSLLVYSVIQKIREWVQYPQQDKELKESKQVSLSCFHS